MRRDKRVLIFLLDEICCRIRCNIKFGDEKDHGQRVISVIRGCFNHPVIRYSSANLSLCSLYTPYEGGGTNRFQSKNLLLNSFFPCAISFVIFFPRNLGSLVAATLRFKGTCIKESHESDIQKKNFD